jgi:hypothetical protein
VLTADLGLNGMGGETVAASPGRWGLEAHEGGVESIYLPVLARYRALTWNPAIGSFCRERLAGYDVTHIYGLYDLIGPGVASACRRIARPYVVEPMGMFLPIVRSLWMKRLYHDTLGSRLLRGASRVIATSEQERDEFLQGGMNESKIVVRRNGIEIPPKFPPAGFFRERWNVAKNVKMILFLGRLVRQQDARRRMLRCAGQRGLRVAALRRVEVMRAVVGDAGQHQRRAIVTQHHMLVLQHLKSDAPQLDDPGLCAGVVLVVARDEVGAVARCELGQWRDRWQILVGGGVRSLSHPEFGRKVRGRDRMAAKLRSTDCPHRMVCWWR